MLLSDNGFRTASGMLPVISRQDSMCGSCSGYSIRIRNGRCSSLRLPSSSCRLVSCIVALPSAWQRSSPSGRCHNSGLFRSDSGVDVFSSVPRGNPHWCIVFHGLNAISRLLSDSATRLLLMYLCIIPCACCSS